MQKTHPGFFGGFAGVGGKSSGHMCLGGDRLVLDNDLLTDQLINQIDAVDHIFHRFISGFLCLPQDADVPVAQVKLQRSIARYQCSFFFEGLVCASADAGGFCVAMGRFRSV